MSQQKDRRRWISNIPQPKPPKVVFRMKFWTPATKLSHLKTCLTKVSANLKNFCSGASVKAGAFVGVLLAELLGLVCADPAGEGGRPRRTKWRKRPPRKLPNSLPSSLFRNCLTLGSRAGSRKKTTGLRQGDNQGILHCEHQRWSWQWLG